MASHPALPDHELSDAEILNLYGPTITEGFRAFTEDTLYVVEMCEHWRVNFDRRNKRRGYSGLPPLPEPSAVVLVPEPTPKYRHRPEPVPEPLPEPEPEEPWEVAVLRLRRQGATVFRIALLLNLSDPRHRWRWRWSCPPSSTSTCGSTASRTRARSGALFVVNVVAGLVIAVMLLRWRHWIPLLLLAGFGATTFGAFLIAVNGTLFGIHTDWSWYAWVAAVSEVVAVVVGVVAAAQEGYLSQVTGRTGVRQG